MHYKNRIKSNILLLRKIMKNQEYYFVAKEHSEEYHSLVDKCLMLFIIIVIVLGVLEHNIS